MRIVAAGDFHGADLGALRETLLGYKPDIYISLGDFDTLECIMQGVCLETELENQGTRIIRVPGNHDAAIYRGMDLFSPYHADSRDSHVQNAEAWQYLENLVLKPSQKIDILGRKAIIVHGGLAGDVDWSVPEEDRILWYRMKEREDIEDNFLKMQELGYSLMIKGHEHCPSLYTFNGEVCLKPGWSNEEYSLGGMNMINPGAYVLGYYCLIEDEAVKFRKINQGQKRCQFFSH